MEKINQEILSGLKQLHHHEYVFCKIDNSRQFKFTNICEMIGSDFNNLLSLLSFDRDTKKQHKSLFKQIKKQANQFSIYVATHFDLQLPYQC